MTRRIYTVVALAGVTGVAGMTALTACGRPAETTGAIVIPVAAVRTTEVPAPASGPGDDLAGAGVAAPAPNPSASSGSPSSGSPAADTPAGEVPVPEPTVAKTQKWVKIFSGPSAKDLKPPKTRAGTHTVELNATESDQIGTYLTDGAGRTLYRFDNDTAKPPKSNCNGDCATAWPPLLIKSPGKIYPKGVDPQIVGYVERADHTCQVTVNGHPVYYFVADAKAGDINGQGVNGKWFAVDPKGGRTTATPVFPAPSAAGSATPGVGK
jgi:predicted lipoprotein with Yx(FWY)xxD motif